MIGAPKASNGGKKRRAGETNRCILGDSPQKNHSKNGFLPGPDMSCYFVLPPGAASFGEAGRLKKPFNFPW
jgi:hypothetical protein